MLRVLSDRKYMEKVLCYGRYLERVLCDWRCVERVCCVMIGMCRDSYVMGGV